MQNYNSSLDFLPNSNGEVKKFSDFPPSFATPKFVGSTQYYWEPEDWIRTRFDVPDSDWLVRGLVCRGYITILYGDGGSGKSLLSMHLARAVSAGYPWLGEEVTPKTRRVAYVDFELTIQTFQRRSVLLDTDDAAWSNVYYFDGDKYRNNTGKVEWRTLREVLDQFKFDLVILDSFGYIHHTGHNEAGEAMESLREIDNLAKRLNAAILLVDHIAKDTGDTEKPKAIGSVYKYNTARSALFIRKTRNAIEVRQTKTNFSEETGWTKLLTISQEHGTLSIVEGITEEHGLAYQIIEVIHMLGGKATLKQIEDGLKKEFEVEVCRNTIAAYCRKLNLPSEGGGKKGRAYGLTFYLPSTFTNGEGRQ
ncbi:MAG: AAA family ATPase [Gloeomargarita sp. SKYB31]|nr:AAA family ATPase [Gloeomargarita sp. SKYB31]